MTRVAINGFGRIGRVALRIMLERINDLADIEIVAINDLAPIDDLLYLLKYDSVHGKLTEKITIDNNYLLIAKHKILILNEKDPKNLPWQDLAIDIVIESTGLFLTREDLSKHILAKAKKVLVTAPTKENGADATICYGVNNQDYNKNMSIISTASCTTNCIAPIAKILDDSLVIKKGLVTTIHSYTNDQRLLDLAHSDKRRSRAASLSMIPTSTGAAKAISLVLPHLKNKFDGLAIRVPTPNVSLVDMVIEVERLTNKEEVNNLLEEASINKFKGILDICYEPLVSIDFNGSNHSSIVDAMSTTVIQGNLIKVLSWYDNEWGFCNRAIDLLKLMSKE